MNTRTTLFGGLMDFNPWLLGLGLILILHAFFHYYRYCYRAGFKVDVWSMNVGIFLATSVGIYPFAAADENSRSVGSHMVEIAANVNRAYLLTLLGYVCALGGFYLHTAFVPRRPRQRLKSYQWMVRVLGTVTVKTNGLKFLTLACVPAQIAITGVVFLRTGQLFNLREAVLSDSTIRPFYNLVFASMCPTLMTWWAVAYFREKDIKNLLWGLPIAIFTLVGGIRGPLVGPFVIVLPLYWMTQRMRVKLWKIAIYAMIALVLILAFGELRRHGDRSRASLRSKAVGEVAYGNSFSDVRDFAWVLAGWDDTLLLGKTYLAGVVDFVPGSLMPYREEWGMGHFTARTAGLDPDTHAGLRPGMFGEAYFNFGICGVILCGVLTGFVWRLFDFHAKQEIYLGRGVVHMYRWVTPMMLLGVLQITAGMFHFYLFCILALAAYLASMFQENAPVNKMRRELEQVAG